MKIEDKALVTVRVVIGWLFFYAGYSKLTNPDWSAAGYLQGAETFNGFYQWLASDGMIGITNFLNAWGLTLIGIALILGLFTRLASFLGAMMMILYWFPVLTFPTVEHGFLVDDHIVYAALLVYLGLARAGRIGGLDAKYHLKNWLG
jgi:thiosulfate dehydrogenase [quinone] large subunit